MKFDHIGIVAPDIAAGRSMLTEAFRIERWTVAFADPVNDVVVQFGLDGSGLCYEAIAPLSEQSPVTHALARGVNILNHTAYLVDSLEAEGRRLRAAGFAPTSRPRPAIAFAGCPIQFFLGRQRLMLELIEAPGHRHQYFSHPSPGAAEAITSPAVASKNFAEILGAPAP